MEQDLLLQVFKELERYLQGGDLFQDFQKGRQFSQQKIVYLLEQVLWGVNHIHSQGIVHRDIKLQNIVYRKKGKNQVKIIDFGSAQYYRGKKLSYKIGSPYYISPEMLRGSYDQRTDIWAIGVCAFIMHFGHPPFTGKTNSQIFKAISNSQNFVRNIKDWKGASTQFRQFLLNLLHASPNKRFTAENALKHSFIREGVPASLNFNSQNAAKLMIRLKNFKPKQKIHVAVLNYLYNQIISTDQIQEQINMFKLLD